MSEYIGLKGQGEWEVQQLGVTVNYFFKKCIIVENGGMVV